MQCFSHQQKPRWLSLKLQGAFFCLTERGERGGKSILFSAGFQGETVVAGHFFLNELKLKKNTIFYERRKERNHSLSELYTFLIYDTMYTIHIYIYIHSTLTLDLLPEEPGTKTGNGKIHRTCLEFHWINLAIPPLKSFQLRLLVGRNHAKDDGPRVLARWSHCQGWFQCHHEVTHVMENSLNIHGKGS